MRELLLAAFGMAVSLGAGCGSSPYVASVASTLSPATRPAQHLEVLFDTPPDDARPWVYWYFMDGHITREGLTADLEAMQKAGIGGAIFLTVNVGVPRPVRPVEFMSAEWQSLYMHAVKEADRLGLSISLGTGPGWSGAGGPWLKPEETMQHLVGSATAVRGGAAVDVVLPRPTPRDPFFGRGGLSPWMLKTWESFYRDEVVLAYPATAAKVPAIQLIDEKALYTRAPYTSAVVRPFLASIAKPPAVAADACLDPNRVIDLTDKLDATGRLTWDAPAGNWTVYRFGRTLTGQNTRPAPDAGLGFESDKFTTAAIAAHADAFIKPLIAQAGKPSVPGRGLTTLHLDSWESGSQNWSEHFRTEFIARRGYDPRPYLPAMLGHFVKDAATTERFLWDLRQTSRELVRDEHMTPLRNLAHQHGLRFTTEGYDMNPAGDLMMLDAGDVQMGEFWSRGFGFKSEFSVIEATSAAHTKGQPIVGAEAFTSENENWQQYPARMKAQTDWALAAGINWFVIHRYQHQPAVNEFPGQRMGPYGVSWERTQTWWDLVPAYHTYLTRCSAMLRQGRPVADILYLTPEGAPHVFRPPASALKGDPGDRRGYSFDGVDPDLLIANAGVKDGRVVLAGGANYGVLVLPRFDTMTPTLLRKIKTLAEAGATILGPRPRKSPSLSGYPACDAEIEAIASTMWGDEPSRRVGQGRVINDPVVIADDQPTANAAAWPDLYADYETTARVLKELNVVPDFEADADLRYTHRAVNKVDVYFVSNPSDQSVSTNCTFRVTGRQPEWWDAVTGERRALPAFTTANGRTTVPLTFPPTGSGFVVFCDPATTAKADARNVQIDTPFTTVAGPWRVAFDPKWGGPAEAMFDSLDDWTKRPEPGIRGYSGKAVYRTAFDADSTTTSLKAGKAVLSLGPVHAMAGVKLNGRDLGVVWCPPWELAVPSDLLRASGNELEVTVANLWINRLITDAGLPESQRLTQTTSNPYKADAPLQPSGLLGPMRLLIRTP